MKKILIVLVCLGLVGCAKSPIAKKFKFGTEPDGFRDIKWATDISTLPDMVYDKQRSEGRLIREIYTIKDEDLRFQNVEVGHIEYWFHRGKFWQVRIEAKGLEKFNALRDTLFKKFGEVPLSTSELANINFMHEWHGDKTDVVLSYDKKLNSTSLIISSRLEISQR